MKDCCCYYYCSRFAAWSSEQASSRFLMCDETGWFGGDQAFLPGQVKGLTPGELSKRAVVNSLLSFLSDLLLKAHVKQAGMLVLKEPVES